MGWSTNAGSWLWLSCSSFFQEFIQTYCPVTFGKHIDPSGNYIRKYLPILKEFPTKYIFEPWKAPDSVQEECNCIIGKDYPIPIVDHAAVSKINFTRLTQVYQYLTSGQSDSIKKGKKKDHGKSTG